MDDYIKRESAEWLICSECCIGLCQKNMCRIINRLNEEIPAADVVDVVRCKDCKYKPYSVDGKQTGFSVHPPDNEAERCPCLCEDGWYSWVPDDEYYCGYGKRRNNDR